MKLDTDSSKQTLPSQAVVRSTLLPNRSPDSTMYPFNNFRQKQEFVLDCCKVSASKMLPYNELNDKYLVEFFDKPVYKKQIEQIESLNDINIDSKKITLVILLINNSQYVAKKIQI